MKELGKLAMSGDFLLVARQTRNLL